MAELIEAFGLDWRLLIIQGINFAILVGALWYLLYKPVLKLLRERERVIAQGVEDAEVAAKSREEIEVARNEKLKAAEAEAGTIVSDAKQHASGERTKILAEAEARAESIVSDAEVRGAELAATAKKDAEKDIARLAVLAAEKVLREKKRS